jgi:hypothetical protein
VPKANLKEYIASGYFLSRYTSETDCAGIKIRRVSLAADHSQRDFFPDAWALSWCNKDRAEQIERAAVFGITEQELDQVIAWADRGFDTAFGAWNVFFRLDEAREAARAFLGKASGLELWGVGLHRDLVSAYCEASKPPEPEPGYAPNGASGVHEATCKLSAPLAEGGEVLGHELLIDDLGCCFNSPESRHMDELAVMRGKGVVPNALGLIDSFDEAAACARHCDSLTKGNAPLLTGWRPWLIVRYPLSV